MRVPCSIRALVAGVLVVCTNGFPAARIDRIDLFDKDDNLLLFVNVQYDSAGRNIGRTVYTADSTYLRSTAFENDAQGNRTAEKSYNFDGDLVLSTTFTPQSGLTLFQTFDQFGLSQYGSPVGYSAPANNVYSLFQNSALINKMNYEYATDGSLTKVSVLDNANNVTYYAIFSPRQSGVANGMLPVQLKPFLTMSAGGVCRLSVDMPKTSRVNIDLYTLSGKISRSKASKLGPGHQTVAFDVSANGERLAPGLYVFTVCVDGKSVLREMRIIRW
jgi:hypothetical protein